MKTNSFNEVQNFSIYIPFYKISFYKSWLLSLQKGCFLASLSHFWLQPSLQRTCNEPATSIGYFVNFMNKLLLDCVRFGFTPIKPNLVALTSLHYNASSHAKTPFTYTPNPPKSCTQTCNRTAPAVLPRHGLTAEYFSWSKPKETTRPVCPPPQSGKSVFFCGRNQPGAMRKRARKGRKSRTGGFQRAKPLARLW